MNLDIEWIKSERDKQRETQLSYFWEAYCSSSNSGVPRSVSSWTKLHRPAGTMTVTMTVIWSHPNHQITLNYILVSPFLYFVKNWDFRSVCLISPFHFLSRIMWMKTHLSILWIKIHLRGRTIHVVRQSLKTVKLISVFFWMHHASK